MMGLVAANPARDSEFASQASSPRRCNLSVLYICLEKYKYIGMFVSSLVIIV